MSTTVAEQHTQTVHVPSLNAEAHYGDWIDEFFKQGYYVFKKAVSPEKAADYYDSKALSWLQPFDNGFDVNNKETWIKENLPQIFNNMYLGYCAAPSRSGYFRKSCNCCRNCSLSQWACLSP